MLKTQKATYFFRSISCFIQLFIIAPNWKELWTYDRVFFLVTIINNCNYSIYWKCIDKLIFLILLETTRDLRLPKTFTLTFIFAVSTLFTFILHLLNFFSSYRTITSRFVKSFPACYVLPPSIKFPALPTKRWWYCWCRFFKSEKWCHWLKDEYPWQKPNPRCSRLFAFK